MYNGNCGYVRRVGEHVKKMSKWIDYTLELERDVMEKLQQLNSPHFAKFVALKRTKYGLELYTKYITDTTLANLYTKACENYSKTTSCCVRTLLAASIMNEQLGIVHNDLHSGNVMIEPCESDVQVYVFSDNIYAVKTYKVQPVIIDFGYAYEGYTATKMRTPITLTEYGFLSFTIDVLADARRIVRFIENYNTKAYNVFRNVRTLSEDGWYNEGKFPDLLNNIVSQLYPKFYEVDDPCSRSGESDDYEEYYPYRKDDMDGVPLPLTYELLNILAAQINLPLTPINAEFDLAEEFDTLVKEFDCAELLRLSKVEQYQFLKDVFDKRPKLLKRYKITQHILRKVQKHSKRVVLALTNFIVHRLRETKTLQLVQQQNSLALKQTVRQVAEYFMEPVEFCEGNVVEMYNVETRQTTFVTLTKESVQLVNASLVNIMHI